MRIDRKLIRGFDIWTLLLVFALFCVGLIYITNATAYPFTGEEESFGQMLENLNFSYTSLHAVWFTVGLCAAAVICAMDYHIYGELAKLAYVAVATLLVMLLIIGVATRGTKGWFSWGSARSFQPSELMKVVLIVLVSKYAAQAVDDHGAVKFMDFIKIGLYVAVPLALVAAQPDFGTAFVFICIFMVIMFAAKLSWRLIAASVITLAGGVTLAFFTVMEEYQKNRILGFLGMAPEEVSSDITHNVDRAQQAIGSGGRLGKGFFTPGSFVQLDYLPEKHTDFIYAAGVEATGFVGGTIVIVLYLLLILRLLYLSSRAKDSFGSFLIIGVVALLFSHVFENVAMNIGVMPVTGIPLPFISYGGSNMLANMCAIGLVLNVAMRRPQKAYEYRSSGI